MLKHVYLLTNESNRSFYREKHLKNVNDLREDLLENGCTFELEVAPLKLEKEWLSQDAIALTDCPKLLGALARARGNAVYFKNETNTGSEIPWDCGYILEGFDSFWYESLIAAFDELRHTTRVIRETERLIIRESRVEDVDDFYRIYSKSGMTDYTEALFKDPEDERQYMRDYIREIYGFYGYGVWTLVLKATGEVIGRAGVSAREGYSALELGYLIDRAYQNRGLAKEACLAIIDYAKNTIDVQTMQAMTREENIPSVRLLKSLGFKYEKNVEEKGETYQLFTMFM